MSSLTPPQVDELLRLARSRATGFHVGAEAGWDDGHEVTVFFIGDAPGAEEADRAITRALVLRCLDEDWPADFAVETRPLPMATARGAT